MPRTARPLKGLPQATLTEDEQQLRDLWNVPERGEAIDTEGGEVNMPKSPPMFRPAPTIVGKELSGLAENMFRIAPNLRGKASPVQFGPGRAATEIFKKSKLGSDKFGRSNILGVSLIKEPIASKRLDNVEAPYEINLNPNLGMNVNDAYDSYNPEGVLAHEFTHASGYRHPAMYMDNKPMGRDEPVRAEDLMWKIRGWGPYSLEQHKEKMEEIPTNKGKDIPLPKEEYPRSPRIPKDMKYYKDPR